MNPTFLDTFTKTIDTANRQNLERATRPLNIVTLMIWTMLSGVLSFVGMFTGGLASLPALPLSTTLLMLGMVLSLISLPTCALLTCCRTLLGAIRELEKRLEEFNHAA